MTGVDGQRDRGVGPTRTDSSSSPTHHPMRPSPAGDLSRRSEEGGGTRFRRLGRRQQCRGHRPPTGLVRRTVSARSHRLWGRIRFARFRPARGDQGLTGGARTPAGCGPEGAESSGCRQPSGSCRSREAPGGGVTAARTPRNTWRRPEPSPDCRRLPHGRSRRRHLQLLDAAVCRVAGRQAAGFAGGRRRGVASGLTGPQRTRRTFASVRGMCGGPPGEAVHSRRRS
jgi:hypothetical protein